MHINEIKGFASRVNLDKQFSGRNAQVIVILPKDGKKHYIARTGGTTLNKDEAFVHLYDQHNVAGQVEQVIQLMGVNPQVEEV